MRLRRCWLAVAALALIGCRGPAPALPEAAAISVVPPLAAGEWLTRAGAWPGPAEFRVQLATFTDGTPHSGSPARMVVRYDVELSAERLLLVAHTTLGAPLYQAELREGVVSVNAHDPRLDDDLLARTIGDFVLANWPLPRLVAAFAVDAFEVADDGARRTLRDPAGVLLLEIRRTGESGAETLEIVHHDAPLRVAIQTLERGIMAP